MAEAATYLLTLGLYSFVICGTALIRHEFMLVICMPPVFFAGIMGFIMAIYAGDTFGWPATAAALLLGAPCAWVLAHRFRPRDMLVSVYLVWAIAMLLSLVGFSFPDHAT